MGNGAPRAGRIVAYDRARALAVMGMIVVNTIKLMGIRHLGPGWLEHLVDLITGRAAVVFVMLAGIGLVLAYDRAPMVEKIALRRRMIVRAALLGLIGTLLMRVWRADILHYYTAYILLGVILLETKTFRLLSMLKAMTLISLPICMIVVYEFEGGQSFETLFFDHPLSPVVDFLFLGNYYPVFPWFCFFLMGMLLGRLERTFDGRRYRRIFSVGIAVFIVIEALSTLLNTDTLAGRGIDIDNPLWRALIISEAFPVSSLFVLSAGASGAALIALLRLAPDGRPGNRWSFSPLLTLGRMSLTVYILHILIAHAYSQWIIHRYGMVSGHQAFLFTIGFLVAGTLFAGAWSRRFKQGPLELGMNRLTRFIPDAPRPSWQLGH